MKKTKRVSGLENFWNKINIDDIDKPQTNYTYYNVINSVVDKKVTPRDATELILKPKQEEYWVKSNKKYNFKVGAAGVGKTFLDLFVIPARILEAKKRGLKHLDRIVLIGRTMSSLCRNIVDPLRDLWGQDAIGPVRSNGSCKMFGVNVVIFGADNKNASKKIQGLTVIYAYGDEVATWVPSVYKELMNRMRSDYSIFDGSCNPEDPDHWLKQVIDKLQSDAEKARQGLFDEEQGVPYKDEIFYQHYVLDDGNLSEDVKASIKRALRGTVEYQRRVLGLWASAEGLIYNVYAGKPEEFVIGKEELPKFKEIQVGVDFGYGRANHAMVATAISEDGELIALRSRTFDSSRGGPTFLQEKIYEQVEDLEAEYGVPVTGVFYDAANKTFGDGIESEFTKHKRYRTLIDKCFKGEIYDRIVLTQQLMNCNKFFHTDDCESLSKGLRQAVWDPKSKNKTRLDNETTDIDTLDAFEYSFNNRRKELASIE